MKSLMALLILFSSPAFAAGREFRINPETVTRHGFATAWGVRDTTIDFEAVEQSDETIQNFLTKYDGQIVNYIVDVERNLILAEIPSDAYYGHLGDLTLGNFYSLTLNEIETASGLQSGQYILYLTENWKWDNSFSDAYLIGKNGQQTTMIKHYDLKDDVHEALNTQLSEYQKKILENKALNYELVTDPVKATYTLKINGYIPKCSENCEIVDITADADFNVINTGVPMELKNVQFSTHQE